MVDSLKDVIPIKQGADYNLGHPLGSNDVPTDPRALGKDLVLCHVKVDGLEVASTARSYDKRSAE